MAFGSKQSEGNPSTGKAAPFYVIRFSLGFCFSWIAWKDWMYGWMKPTFSHSSILSSICRVWLFAALPSVPTIFCLSLLGGCFLHPAAVSAVLDSSFFVVSPFQSFLMFRLDRGVATGGGDEAVGVTLQAPPNTSMPRRYPPKDPQHLFCPAKQAFSRGVPLPGFSSIRGWVCPGARSLVARRILGFWVAQPTAVMV